MLLKAIFSLLDIWWNQTVLGAGSRHAGTGLLDARKMVNGYQVIRKSGGRLSGQKDIR